MDGKIERSVAGEVTTVGVMSGDGSLPWYKVVGIEFVLLVAILVPLIYGAVLAR